ncbi:flippase [Methanococcus maripaludis]|uniref:O-antigen/teichoic acid export membrane protein n=1 Tax=Methanococcus maripaludis TaxID=39152 RepID=A0A2L1CCM4_METMI|nr:flippase [Methanococcus maripaludis]AVB77128.1 Polysaccharide biosynthesis protein [Methanococcus maripaludis]MBA2863640.1 O-antigen/teichoic acid export membrane protein [Methanococcus maripaludis]
MSYKERVLKGVSWNFLLLLAAAPIGYFVRILYSNEIPKLDVGLFYAVFDFCCMIAIFKNLGLNAALVRFIPKYLHEKRLDLVKSSIICAGVLQTTVSLIMTLLIILLSSFIATYYINNQGQFTGQLDLVICVLIILSIGYWFQSIMDVVANSIWGFQNQKYYGTINFVKIFMVLIISFILIHVFDVRTVFTPICAYTLAPILMIFIYTYIFIKKIFPEFFIEKFSFSKKLTKDLFSYGLPLMMGSAGALVLNYIDGICLTYFAGLNAVADYRNVAMPTVSILRYFATAVGAVLFPMSSELWEMGHGGILGKSVEKICLYSFVAVFPITVLTAYFPEVIVNLFFNTQYLPAADAIRILSLGTIFFTLNSIGFNVLNGIGKSLLSTKIIYFGAIFNLIFNILLIPKFGIVGASATTVLGYLLMWILQARYLGDFINYSNMLKKWLITTLLGVFSLIPLIFVTKIINNIILQLSVGMAVYLGVYALGIILFKIIEIEKLKEMFRIGI